MARCYRMLGSAQNTDYRARRAGRPRSDGHRIPIGQVSAGPLAEALGPRPALILLSGVIVAAVAAMLCNRAVRRLQHAR